MSGSLDDLAAELAARHDVPGLVVGAVVGDEVMVGCAGVTSVDDPLPMTPQTLCFIGSTTKVLTATAVVALVEQGRVALDDPVRDVVGDLRFADPAVGDAVTVRHLLTHTAGWRGDAEPGDGWGASALADSLSILADLPQEHPLGAVASYNNTALALAGRVVEVVTGVPYERAVAELVLGPLGMAHTGFLPWELAHRRIAAGHLVVDGTARRIGAWPATRALGPVGGALSTVEDQLRLARWAIDGGAGPVGDGWRREMQQPQVPMRSGATGVGLIWLLDRYGDEQLVTHGGNLSNLHVSSFACCPSRRLAVTVMANSRGGRAAGRDALAWLMAEAGVPEGAPMAHRPPDAAERAALAGTYDAGAWAVRLVDDGSRLTLRRDLPEGTPSDVVSLFEMAPVELACSVDDPDVLVDIADATAPVADVGRGADGSVAWLRWGMRASPRLR